VIAVERIPGTNLPLTRGAANNRWRPVGSVVVKPPSGNRRRPCVMVKVRDDGPSHDRWRYLSVVVWERAHGPIPPGWCLWFRDRNSLNCRLENLECITLAERLARNKAEHPDPFWANAARQGRVNGPLYWRAARDANRLAAHRRALARANGHDPSNSSDPSDC
jgi:hypothetical protein